MKKGMTLVSIIIYLILFTTFTAFVISFSSNMNRNVLGNSGKAEIQMMYSKVYVNLFDSAKNSSYYTLTETSIKFSNGDIYVFDVSNNSIYKNGGILSSNLSSFDFKEVVELGGINISTSKLERCKSICINVEFTKYGNSLSRDLVVALGDGI